MAKGKALSDFEKGQIQAFFDSGISKREIARRLGRSLCVVCNFLSKADAYGKTKGLFCCLIMYLEKLRSGTKAKAGKSH